MNVRTFIFMYVCLCYILFHHLRNEIYPALARTGRYLKRKDYNSHLVNSII
jgi:hypothetical protein